MLAYDPGVIMGFESHLTLASLGVAVVSTAASLTISAWLRSDWAPLAAGTLFGLGVSSMHFMGMRAIEFPGHFLWDNGLVVIANVFAITLAIPAFIAIIRARGELRAAVFSTLLLGSAVIAMHFTGMGAVTVVPGPAEAVSDSVISPVVLIVTITTVALSMLFSGMAAAIFAVRAETMAQAGEDKFRRLIHSVTDYAIYMLDTDGRVSNWNIGAERAKGYAEAEIVGQPFSKFYTEDDKTAGLPDANLEIARTTGKFEGEGWRVRKDGTHFWVHVTIDAIHNEQGSLIGFAKITHDQTNRMLAEKKVQEASDELKLALRHMANALCLFNGEGKLAMHNRRLNEMIGISETHDLRGKTLEEICNLNPTNADNRLRVYRELIARKDGDVITELANGKMVRTTYMPTDTEAWVLTVEDVTDRIQSERRIAHLARHDALTGLPNRRQFLEVLDGRIKTASVLSTRVAIVNIDLDRFKDINDTYGHAVGDEVLCILSERVRKELKDGEEIGRFGGDEFVAMKAYGHMNEIHDFISRLRKALTEKISLPVTDIVPGASFGIAVFPTDAQDREKLLSNADMAMYRAKEDPIETVCFYEASMDEAERERRTIAKDIWTGLAEGQFFLHYQVQKAAVTHETTGYEVLLRWQHPTRGIIPPSVFIPIAEECGAIAPLGEWVLQEACADAAGWSSNEKIAVNLSPLQLSNSQLVEKVREILLTTRLAPNRLELEVTESAIITDKTRTLHMLRQLRSMGVTIAIDDFGTGYSSLETLRSFPFDKIKLDRSFVSGLDTDRQARAFVRAILALGKSLEIPVLAEGVETESQMRVLTQEGCNQFQGYYLGRPDLVERVVVSFAKAAGF